MDSNSLSDKVIFVNDLLSVCAQQSRLTLACDDPDCWISLLPLTCDVSAANCTIYSQGDNISSPVSSSILLYVQRAVYSRES